MNKIKTQLQTDHHPIDYRSSTQINNKLPLSFKAIILIELYKKKNQHQKQQHFNQNPTKYKRKALLTWYFNTNKKTIITNAIEKILVQQKISPPSFFYRIKKTINQQIKMKQSQESINHQLSLIGRSQQYINKELNQQREADYLNNQQSSLSKQQLISKQNNLQQQKKEDYLSEEERIKSSQIQLLMNTQKKDICLQKIDDGLKKTYTPLFSSKQIQTHEILSNSINQTPTQQLLQKQIQTQQLSLKQIQVQKYSQKSIQAQQYSQKQIQPKEQYQKTIQAKKHLQKQIKTQKVSLTQMKTLEVFIKQIQTQEVSKKQIETECFQEQQRNVNEFQQKHNNKPFQFFIKKQAEKEQIIPHMMMICQQKQMQTHTKTINYQQAQIMRFSSLIKKNKIAQDSRNCNINRSEIQNLPQLTNTTQQDNNLKVIKSNSTLNVRRVMEQDFTDSLIRQIESQMQLQFTKINKIMRKIEDIQLQSEQQYF